MIHGEKEEMVPYAAYSIVRVPGLGIGEIDRRKSRGKARFPSGGSRGGRNLGRRAPFRNQE